MPFIGHRLQVLSDKIFYNFAADFSHLFGYTWQKKQKPIYAPKDTKFNQNFNVLNTSLMGLVFLFCLEQVVILFSETDSVV